MDQGSDGEEDATADLNQLDEAFVKLDVSVAATQAPAASAHGDDRGGQRMKSSRPFWPGALRMVRLENY